ncbi:LysR family transcriptional regulator [Vibrio algicola]|uniref:LysR family transcriptional regulator n=1 Tax=Vibrio algicola TaxID=2662262 RepID=A0A5Q0TGQ5_9VIBR|nr:LysR family transcriptional regulator [Vibrio algicola]
MSKLNQVDLNLLVALQALLRTRSVTKAAIQLNVTQSAMSRTLQRLRHQFGDPLFVRNRGGLLPTERAQSLATSLDCLLQDAESLLTPAEFDPLQATTQFSFMMTDFFSQVFMPPVFQSLFEQAPNMRIQCLNSQPNLMEMLAQGETDLGFSSLAGAVSADIYAQKLGQDSLVTVMRKDHPLAGQELTLERYCQASHALITMGGDHLGTIDVALAKLGYKRHVALRMPHFTAAPHAVAKTDLLLTLPGCLAAHMAEALDLVIVPPPLDMQPFTYYMVWHARQHNNIAHRWLRQQLQQVITQRCLEGNCF